MKSNGALLAGVCIAFAVAGCSGPTEQIKQSKPQQLLADESPEERGDVGRNFELGEACKKYIGGIMGRPVSSIRVDYEEDGGSLIGVSYIRESDNKQWKYECTSEGDNIIWRGVDIFEPGEGPGRWRTEDAKPISSL